MKFKRRSHLSRRGRLDFERLGRFELLEARALLAADPILAGQPVIISEFMADNGLTLVTRTRSSPADPFEGEVQSPDWIELFNVSGHRVELSGMHLTDDAADPTKWEFPEGASIEAGSALVVFASGNDIRDPALDERGLLHTDFGLSATGDYLALTDRDGVVIHEYTPTFAPQRKDISSNVPMEVRSLLGPDAAIEYLVPRDDSHDPLWRSPGFAHPDLVGGDGGAQSPIGFDRGDGPIEQGVTVGGEVIDRDSSDFARGSIVVLESDPFTVSGQVAEWSFYSETTRSVTPLILRASGGEFEITGIGQTRVSDGSGAQTFRFDAQVGSDLVAAGEYFFGFKDGDNQIDDPGAVVYSRSDSSSVRRYNGPLSGKLNAGEVLAEGRSFERVYSVHATLRTRLAGPFGTDVSSAMAQSSSIYVRYPFKLDRRETLRAVSLQIRYDDGFIAYLNGNEVARRNVPAAANYAARAETNRSLELANQYEEINISSYLGALVEGDNVLAIHGFNDEPSEAEFLIDARLTGVDIAAAAPLGFAAEATPGGVNGVLYAGLLDAPVFSHARGFYDQPFMLELTSPAAPDAAIYYTLDGSDPVPGNPQVVQFTQPIEVGGTTIVRAASYLQGRLPSPLQTHTYIFPSDIVQQSGMQPAITQHPVWGPQLIESLQAVPSISLVTEHSLTGTDELRTSIEMIRPDGGPGFQIDAGIEVYGGTAVSYPKRSVRLSFKNDYGPSQLDFDVFDDSDGVQHFNQLLLRAGSQDTSFWNAAAGAGNYIRNRWASDRQLEMGHPAPRGRFVQLYVNGAYWGQYHLMERPNAAFMEANFGGDASDYDVLNAGTPVDGDLEAWNHLLDSLDDGYEAVKQYLDVVNYADYVLMQWFAGNNVDWRFESNWMAARKREPGAGFKFFAWDSDVMLRTGLDVDIVNFGGPGFLWTLNGGVQQYPEFRQLLAERAQLYFFGDGMFTPERLRQDIDELAEQIRLSVIGETARWGSGLYTPDSWEAAIEWVKDTYAPEEGPTRTDVVLEQMRRAGYFPLVDQPQFVLDGQPLQGDGLTVGSELAMSAPLGDVYFTLDGSDPRASEPTVEKTTFVGESSAVKVLVPTSSLLGTTWREIDFDDSAWTAGTNGVGYDTAEELTSHIELDIGESMNGVSASAYLRIPFEVDDPAQFDTLELGVRYDDGYVAYLNGVEIARRNAPPSPAWNAAAATPHANVEAVELEWFNLTRVKHLLQPGKNVLAVHGLNAQAANVDFLLEPVLQAGRVTDQGIAPTAMRLTAPIVVPEAATVRARTVWLNQWSTLRAAAVPVPPFPLRIAELMYHPADPSPQEVAAGFTDGDEFEFIELLNVSSETVDLAEIELVQTDHNGEVEGVGFSFGLAGGALTQLEPGQRVVIVENRAAFEFRYGNQVAIAGEWTGGLGNDAEQLTVMDGDRIAHQFTYDDDWHPQTDGEGSSLEIIDATSDDLAAWNLASSWRASVTSGGSPGRPPGEIVVGDVNGDDIFDSNDLLAVLQAGHYEDAQPGNATFDTGDWNGDGDFTTADLVLAFQQGHYVDDAPPLAAASASAAPTSSLSLIARDRVFQRWAEGEESLEPLEGISRKRPLARFA
jgi:hypothetical protein